MLYVHIKKIYNFKNKGSAVHKGSLFHASLFLLLFGFLLCCFLFLSLHFCYSLLFLFLALHALFLFFPGRVYKEG